MKLALLIIYAVIGTVPLVFAAVQPWIWSAYSVAVFIAFVLVLWSKQNPPYLTRNRFFFFSVVLFFAVTLFQFLPLPPRALSFLSPYRYHLLEKCRVLIDAPVSWQSISYSPSSSLSWWIFLLSLLIFFLVLRKVIPYRRHLHTVILIVIITGSFEAFYGLLQALIPSLGVLWVDTDYNGCARGTYICRNHFAGFLEMVWPLALGYTMSYGDWHGREEYHESGNKRLLRKVISSDRLHRQVFLVLIIGIMLLALLFSRSRAGITGAGVGLLTFTLLVYYANRRLSKGFWMIIGAVLLLLFVYGNQMGFDPIIERFMVILEGNIYRTDLWRDGIAIVKDHPLGIGLGNLHQVMPVYLTSTVSEVTVFSHIHNDYLQVLIEAGWPGFLILVSSFIVFIVISIGRIVKLNLYEQPSRFFIGAGALSGLISMAFHSFFDFNLQIPANCFYFVLLICLVYVCGFKTD